MSLHLSLQPNNLSGIFETSLHLSAPLYPSTDIQKHHATNQPYLRISTPYPLFTPPHYYQPFSSISPPRIRLNNHDTKDYYISSPPLRSSFSCSTNERTPHSRTLKSSKNTNKQGIKPPQEKACQKWEKEDRLQSGFWYLKKVQRKTDGAGLSATKEQMVAK